MDCRFGCGACPTWNQKKKGSYACAETIAATSILSKSKTTSNRDVTWLPGVSLARFPVNWQGVAAWRSRGRKCCVSDPKPTPCYLKASDVFFLSIRAWTSPLFRSVINGGVRGRVYVALCLLSLPNKKRKKESGRPWLRSLWPALVTLSTFYRLTCGLLLFWEPNMLCLGWQHNIARLFSWPGVLGRRRRCSVARGFRSSGRNRCGVVGAPVAQHAQPTRREHFAGDQARPRVFQVTAFFACCVGVHQGISGVGASGRPDWS